MILESRVTILVKAYPQPSKKHSETVCCAGIDGNGNWKRLFPIRFRQLSGDQVFSRWNIVDFKYERPSRDHRDESCSVHEDSIKNVGKVTSEKEKQNIVERALVASESEAANNGASLALIRPRNVKLTWTKRSEIELEEAKNAFEAQAKQATMFDKTLDALSPCPYVFKMSYEDGGGSHNKTCADWETSAAYFNLERKYDDKTALNHLRAIYSEEYVKTGLVFALGNIAARPQTWQLLGIFPLKPSAQLGLDL